MIRTLTLITKNQMPWLQARGVAEWRRGGGHEKFQEIRNVNNFDCQGFATGGQIIPSLLQGLRAKTDNERKLPYHIVLLFISQAQGGKEIKPSSGSFPLYLIQSPQQAPFLNTRENRPYFTWLTGLSIEHDKELLLTYCAQTCLIGLYLYMLAKVDNSQSKLQEVFEKKKGSKGKFNCVQTFLKSLAFHNTRFP